MGTRTVLAVEIAPWANLVLLSATGPVEIRTKVSGGGRRRLVGRTAGVVSGSPVSVVAVPGRGVTILTRGRLAVASH